MADPSHGPSHGYNDAIDRTLIQLTSTPNLFELRGNRSSFVSCLMLFMNFDRDSHLLAAKRSDQTDFKLNRLVHGRSRWQIPRQIRPLHVGMTLLPPTPPPPQISPFQTRWSRGLGLAGTLSRLAQVSNLCRMQTSAQYQTRSETTTTILSRVEYVV